LKPGRQATRNRRLGSGDSDQETRIRRLGPTRTGEGARGAARSPRSAEVRRRMPARCVAAPLARRRARRGPPKGRPGARENRDSDGRAAGAAGPALRSPPPPRRVRITGHGGRRVPGVPWCGRFLRRGQPSGRPGSGPGAGPACGGRRPCLPCLLPVGNATRTGCPSLDSARASCQRRMNSARAGRTRARPAGRARPWLPRLGPGCLGSAGSLL
jgi:hypothetical protein